MDLLTLSLVLQGPSLFAHGGAGGAALEIGFVSLPILAFAFMAVWTGRKRKREEEERKNHENG